MMPGASPVAAAGRGLVGLFAVPLLAVAMARNRDWRVDIHVSRTLVLHTAALVASGVFCMSLAAAGLLVRELGGAWGPQFELLTLVGSAVVLVSVMGSRDLRVHLKRFVSRHFYSHRFDYRTEWLRFVETVSQPGAQGDSAPGARGQGPRADRGQPGGFALVFAGRAWLCPGSDVEPADRAGAETAAPIMCSSPVSATAPGSRSGRRRQTAAWPFDPARRLGRDPAGARRRADCLRDAGSAAERLPSRLGDIRPASRSRAAGGQLPRRGALDASARSTAAR